MNHLELYMEKSDLQKIRECEDLYLKSATLVRILFLNKTDPVGIPYLYHLQRVSDRMTTYYGQVAGLLHDLVEDIEGITFDDLRDIGIPNEIIEVLRLVTNEKSNYPLTKEEKLVRYGKKIDQIIASGNPVAIELKFIDMMDNYDEERLALCSCELRSWFEQKYPPQLDKLSKVMKLEKCA